MSFLSVLKSVGKDLGHVGSWIEEAAKVAAPIVTAVDPPLGAIITGVESVIATLESASSTPPTAASIQAIVEAVSTIETIKAQASSSAAKSQASSAGSPPKT
jgi:hypothetical protein